MIAWWAIGRTAAQSITFTLVGRLSDIFGRRWFFIGGNVVALIGTAVTASSQNIAQLVVGSAITGVGEAVQNSYTIALPELVKNKHRPIVVSLVFASSAPFATFGSIIGECSICRPGSNASYSPLK
jgi:MFS family permease